MMQREEFQVVVLLSAWSSGSTSIAGYLDRCGAFTCPPHQQTNDPRTPNSFESLDFRNAMTRFTDELTLRVTGRREDFTEWFARWLPRQKQLAAQAGHRVIALKHPLAVNLVSQIHAVSDCRFVLITRSMQSIEATRMRRGWAPVYGELGAKAIYSTAWAALFNAGLSNLSIPYEAFMRDPELRRLLLDYCGLRPEAAQLASAESWLRPA